MNKETIKLIYIVGTGHCGSTLLDLVVGSAPEVFSTGELAFYNIYRKKKKYKQGTKNYLCTCGKDFHKCNIWKSTFSQEFNIKKFFTFGESIHIVLSVMFPQIFSYFQEDDSDKLLAMLAERGDQNDIVYFVDSSKDSRILKVLLNNPNIEVYPIFLIRESGGVGYSYSRKGRKQESKNFYLTLVKWLIINLITKKMLEKNPKKLVFKYKVFCEYSKKIIKSINKNLNINISERNFLEEINKIIYHNIDGNVLRFEELKEIKYNHKWKNKVNAVKKQMNYLINSFFYKNE